MSAAHTEPTVHLGSAQTGARIALWLVAAVVALIAAYVFLRCVGAVPAGAILWPDFANGPLLDWIEQLPRSERLMAAGGALLVGLVALWSMLRQGTAVRAPRGNGAVHVLEADERGVVVMANDGIEAVVRMAVQGTPGVFECEAHARPSGRGLALRVDVQVIEGADARRAGLGARARAIEAIERLVGLEVHAARVRVDVISPQAFGRSLR